MKIEETRFEIADRLVEKLKKDGCTNVKICLYDYDHTVIVRFKDKGADKEIIVQLMLRSQDPVGVINNEQRILDELLK